MTDPNLCHKQGTMSQPTYGGQTEEELRAMLKRGSLPMNLKGCVLDLLSAISKGAYWPRVTACGSLEDPGVVLTFPDGASAVYVCIATGMAGELWSRINERDLQEAP
jgi:hypothetical protein